MRYAQRSRRGIPRRDRCVEGQFLSYLQKYDQKRCKSIRCLLPRQLDQMTSPFSVDSLPQ